MTRKANKKKWLASAEGRLWVEQQIAAKHAARPDPGPNPFAATKFPFKATINGKDVIVWPDWIEREDKVTIDLPR